MIHFLKFGQYVICSIYFRKFETYLRVLSFAWRTYIKVFVIVRGVCFDVFAVGGL